MIFLLVRMIKIKGVSGALLAIAAAGCLYENASAQRIKWNEYKLTFGYGTSIYWGHARQTSLPRSQYKEWTKGFSLGAYKVLSNKVEVGGRYSKASVIGYKDATSWGWPSIFETQFDEICLQMNYSINKNSMLLNEIVSPTLSCGLGANYYTARFGYYDPYLLISSVGEGRTTPGNVPERLFAPFVMFGIGVQFRLTPSFSIGFENYFNQTFTQTFTGITFIGTRKSFDSYSVNMITLSYRPGGFGNKLSCPRM